MSTSSDNPSYAEWRRTNWDRAHREGDLSALTGNDLAYHVNRLHVADQIIDARTILCIGVGTGRWIAELTETKTNAEVWALDISHWAGKKLPSTVRFSTKPNGLPRHPWFDLAMSLWVAPHMSDHDLQDQLMAVIRCLCRDGMLAIHYKEPLKDDQAIDNREGADDEYFRAKSAMMLRRRRHFAEMVGWAGGRVIRIVDEFRSPFYQTIEVVAHVGRTGDT